MNTTQMLAIVIILACVANLVAIVFFALQRGRRERDLRQLAEREDANGRELLMIARGMRNHALHLPQEEPKAPMLRRWAATCERSALEHLEAINAIGLHALSDVTGRPVYLGELNRQVRPGVDFANVKGPRFSVPMQSGEGARHG